MSNATKTGLASRETLSQMVATWESCSARIADGMRILHEAQKDLEAVFGNTSGSYFSICGVLRTTTLDRSDRVLERFERDAWAALFRRMEVRQFLSASASAELDRQLDGRGQPLGPISLDNVMTTLEALHSSIPELAADSVREVFDYLRPRRSALKTNLRWQVGPRVIISGAVERHDPRWPFAARLQYGHIAHLRSLDRVFHLLDGAGYVSKSHGGDICDAITALPHGEDYTETAYFALKCCKNGNLHITFRRPDLVARLNEVAGGMQLAPAG